MSFLAQASDAKRIDKGAYPESVKKSKQVKEQAMPTMRSLESRMLHARLGLICCGIAALGLIFSAVGSKATVGYSFPRNFLFLSLLGDAYGAVFFLWLLKRLKKQSEK
jgi:short subunit fatty acids transporter